MTAFVIILLITNIVLFILLIATMAKSTQSGGGSVEKGELVHDNIMVQKELSEFSDNLLDKIDSRIGSLKHLIQEADDRIKTMDAMSGGAMPAPRAPRTPPPAPRRQPPEPVRPTGDNTAAGKPSSPQSRRTAILSLARRGYTVQQIAQEVRMGRGEVEFILNVERQRK